MKKILFSSLILFSLVGCSMNVSSMGSKNPTIPEWAYGKWACEASVGDTYEITKDSFIQIIDLGETKQSYVFKQGDGMTTFTNRGDVFTMVAKGFTLGASIDEEWEFSKIDENTIRWKVVKGNTQWNGSKETNLVRITEGN